MDPPFVTPERVLRPVEVNFNPLQYPRLAALWVHNSTTIRKLKSVLAILKDWPKIYNDSLSDMKILQQNLGVNVLSDCFRLDSLTDGLGGDLKTLMAHTSAVIYKMEGCQKVLEDLFSEAKTVPQDVMDEYERRQEIQQALQEAERYKKRAKLEPLKPRGLFFE